MIVMSVLNENNLEDCVIANTIDSHYEGEFTSVDNVFKPSKTITCIKESRVYKIVKARATGIYIQ